MDGFIPAAQRSPARTVLRLRSPGSSSRTSSFSIFRLQETFQYRRAFSIYSAAGACVKLGDMRFGNGIHWSTRSRCLVFLLAATSIACLLFDFYGLCPMRLFTWAVFVPAMLTLAGWAFVDWQGGDGQLGRAVLIGLVGGLLAAIGYDIFRLPFVFAKEWGIASIIKPMNLFKVFPRFGAMILGQPIEQTQYSTAASTIGWAYHFSNGATFGVMYISMIGDARRKHWAWAVLMAVGLELGMLLTPYPKIFNIPVTARFTIVTMAAHAIFGVVMGLSVREIAKRFAGSGSILAAFRGGA
jgi:hypothetical protein